MVKNIPEYLNEEVDLPSDEEEYYREKNKNEEVREQAIQVSEKVTENTKKNLPSLCSEQSTKHAHELSSQDSTEVEKSFKQEPMAKLSIQKQDSGEEENSFDGYESIVDKTPDQINDDNSCCEWLIKLVCPQNSVKEFNPNTRLKTPRNKRQKTMSIK